MLHLDLMISIISVLFLSQNLAFFLSRFLKRYDIADIFWALGFVEIALQVGWSVGVQNPRALWMSGLTILWGLRLATYLSVRARGVPEDRRYREWRQAWGANERLRSYLQIFLLQGLILFIVASPLWLVGLSQFNGWGVIDGVGVCLWTFGFIFESVADEQMRRFRLTKKPGDVLKSGLWSLSRHPNYFGELCVWWGLYAVALGASSWAAGSFVGPALLTFLLLKVSGVTLIESARAQNQAYQDYQSQTPALVPRLFGKRPS